MSILDSVISLRIISIRFIDLSLRIMYAFDAIETTNKIKTITPTMMKTVRFIVIVFEA